MILVKAQADAGGKSTKSETSHRESDDAYRSVIAELSPGWRVIVCRDGIQWIVQRRRAAGRHGGRWRGVHYCRTRDALIRLCVTSCDRMAPAGSAILQKLSKQIGGPHGQA